MLPYINLSWEYKNMLADDEFDLKIDRVYMIVNQLSHTPKKKFLKFPNYDLYYSSEIYLYPIFNHEDYYNCTYRGFEFVLIFDNFNKNKFIIGFCNSLLNENYREYIHITISPSNIFEFNNIPNPMAYENNKGTFWNFNIKNKTRELLYNNIFYVIVQHKDDFDGNLSIMVHDITLNLRTQYDGFCPNYDLFDFEKIKISNDKLQFFDFEI